MRNYYLQLNDLVIAKARLNTLLNKLKRLEDNITSCTNKTKEVVVTGGFSSDKMDKYLIEKEEVLSEIKQIKEDIDYIENNLRIMEEALRKMNGIQAEIFVMYHIDGLKPKVIAKKIPCDLSTVYKHLKEINKKIYKSPKKSKKIVIY